MKKIIAICTFAALAASFYALVGYGESNIFTITDNTLPVELSSFSASASASGHVSIAWTTESESALLGFRIFRAGNGDLAGATLLTPESIIATNTSSSHTYLYEDSEVSVNNTYFYWLESVSANSSDFFGPVSVAIEVELITPMPEISYMRSAYPNPFKFGDNTNIDISIKNGETGTFTVYNLLGQAVKTVALSTGEHHIQWDGRDSGNNSCSSGIYFVNLETPSYTSTTKIVLIK